MRNHPARTLLRTAAATGLAVGLLAGCARTPVPHIVVGTANPEWLENCEFRGDLTGIDLTTTDRAEPQTSAAALHALRSAAVAMGANYIDMGVRDRHQLTLTGRAYRCAL